MLANSIQRLRVAFVLAPLASASTWIVDDDGGIGVHFTSITAAVAAAGPGDVILVRAGSYTGFTLTYGASIVGDPGALITSAVTLSGLPAAPRATLAGLELRTLRIESCSTAVTIEDVLVAPLDTQLGTAPAMINVDQCTDVRLRAVDARIVGTSTNGRPALRATQSRVEIVGCTLDGVDGKTCDWYYAGWAQPGGEGVVVRTSADVHVARSSLSGGYGGDAQAVECQSNHAGDGKPGLRIDAGGSALVSGIATDSIAGGAQGLSNSCYYDGHPASGIVVDPAATLRISGATVTAAQYVYPSCGGPVPPIVGTITQAVPDDPTLSFIGAQLPGQTLTFTVTGAPGDTAALLVGRKLTVVDVVNVVEDQLLLPLRTFDLGTLPASGTASFSIPVPASWVAGQLLVAQGRTTSPLGAISLTHSLPITIR
ncbi:MAG: hypothetical protein HZA52_10270 [Planctomycetes bacterium]|nr:hypothetical protein [Planctomycetota bacterium]